jgi:hypothetical protein
VLRPSASASGSVNSTEAAQWITCVTSATTRARAGRGEPEARARHVAGQRPRRAAPSRARVDAKQGEACTRLGSARAACAAVVRAHEREDALDAELGAPRTSARARPCPRTRRAREQHDARRRSPSTLHHALAQARDVGVVDPIARA